MKSRWMIYALIGIAFGVFDFYYHTFISTSLRLPSIGPLVDGLIWLTISVGIWLVPLIPVILREARTSRSAWRSALAGVLTWSAAVAAYYLTNGFQLAIIGVPSRMDLHISSRSDPHFLASWKSVFVYDLVGGSLEWLVVALVGGASIGFLVSSVYLRRKDAREAASG